MTALVADGAMAQRLLGWLVPDGDSLVTLSVAEVERFCWYELPRKWHADTSEQRRAVAVLADLLTGVGRVRAAAVCASGTTSQVLAAWQRSEEAGFAAYRKAVAASPTTPPDVPELSWGQFMGVREAQARANLEGRLERALDEGELDPDARTFPAARRRFVQQWLTTEQPGFEGRAPLEAVRRERRELWAVAPPTERRALLAAVLPALEEPAVAPVDTAEPLRWLLEQIGDGVTLTQAGYLPREVVAAAFARYPLWYPIGKGPRSEADLFQLADLHELARIHRLVTKRHRTLKLSPAGRALLTDHQRRQYTAALAWLGTTAAERQVAESALGALWAEPRLREDLRDDVHPVLAAGFTHGDGSAMEVKDTERLLWRFWHTGRELGYLDERDRSVDASISLSATGRSAALAALRVLAEGPRDRV
ncbi:hypothetical protein OG819_10995 [Streptomyces sp. NBC_01549]|uniref:hypothetical protein n=1 Tax=Streptomyces sp. NBC_01549 TaxID=2975874 RepID=UPI0022561266|nr:hypothetical protein [Streptomyces sp. NBC_01549]MCX4590270.1 hypothetical protein [Streptomyces sp. NBC_01549]